MNPALGRWFRIALWSQLAQAGAIVGLLLFYVTPSAFERTPRVALVQLIGEVVIGFAIAAPSMNILFRRYRTHWFVDVVIIQVLLIGASVMAALSVVAFIAVTVANLVVLVVLATTYPIRVDAGTGVSAST